mgnify:FL=1
MVDRKFPISFTPKNKTGATSLALRLARNSCASSCYVVLPNPLHHQYLSYFAIGFYDYQVAGITLKA